MIVQPVIGIDIDETVADLHTEWLRRYNRDYNDNLTPEDIYKWEIEEFVKPECGSKIFDYLADPGMYDDDLVTPLPGARAAVHELMELGEVIFVSSCYSQEIAEAKARWVGRHMGIISRLVACGRGESKNKLGADVLIDDHVVNVETFSGWGILVNRPHNRRVGCFRTRIKDLSGSIPLIKTRKETLARLGLTSSDPYVLTPSIPGTA